MFCVTSIASAKPHTTAASPVIQVALLLDTSNSMDGLINQAKAQLWEIVNQLSYAKKNGKNPRLQIALYEYGNSSLSSSQGYLRQVLPFTSNLDEISKGLFSLTTNGGDEFCGQVLQTAVSRLDWTQKTAGLRMIFIAGNEPFTQGPVHYKSALADADEKDITVNTIFCGDYQAGVQGSWKTGAMLGKGDYLTIEHNKNIVAVETPYDQEILQLNQTLNTTYLYYGSSGRKKSKNQSVQDDNALTVHQEVLVKRAVSKTGYLYSNGDWDLVDASKDKKFDLNELKSSDLPKQLQNKTEEELKTIINNKAKQRSDLQRQIRILNKKRNAYIAKHQKEKNNADELENAVITSIKKQATKKGFSW